MGWSIHSGRDNSVNSACFDGKREEALNDPTSPGKNYPASRHIRSMYIICSVLIRNRSLQCHVWDAVGSVGDLISLRSTQVRMWRLTNFA